LKTKTIFNVESVLAGNIPSGLFRGQAAELSLVWSRPACGALKHQGSGIASHKMATDGLEAQVKDLVIVDKEEENVTSVKADVKEDSDVLEVKEALVVLKAEDSNTPTAEPVCAHCKKVKPSKRCAKRHPKCLKKLFCNDTCEMLAHKKKEDTKKTEEDAKKADAKRKKAKENKNSIRHGKCSQCTQSLSSLLTLKCFRIRQAVHALQRL
jgi:hypothetical protein